MAESAESLYRRGMISPRQAGRLGVLRDTKSQPSKMAAFDDKAGVRDQGGIRDRGLPAANRSHIDKNQSANSLIAGKPSKDGFVKASGQPVKRNEIDDSGSQKPDFPRGAKVKRGNAKGFASKQRTGIPKQGGQYGGGGQDTQ